MPARAWRGELETSFPSIATPRTTGAPILPRLMAR
jgi:hypothetical protein